ncbi:MAG: PilZ domain-containing protein, partial [Nitrospirota bacterium]|nr:PilZ domain-containing protein [Nitrospirota bacterium]
MTIKERRASPRLEVHLPIVVLSGDRSWRGVTKSIGCGGVSLAFAGDVPAMLNQQIMLSFNPVDDGLDSLGIVCGIRTAGDLLALDKGLAGVTLAIQFVRLSGGDEQVLSSLLSESRVWPRGVRIVALLAPQEDEEALIDAYSRQPVADAESDACSVQETGEPHEERRRHRRIMVGASGAVSLREAPGARNLPDALTENLASNDDCMSAWTRGHLVAKELSRARTRSDHGSHETGTASLPAAGCAVMDGVMWRTTERAGAIPGTAEVNARTVFAGVRFLQGSKETDDVVDHFTDQAQEGTVDEVSGGPSVITEYSECFRRSGSRIVLCYDRPRTDATDGAPIIVLAPGYGESKRDYVPLAYYL